MAGREGLPPDTDTEASEEGILAHAEAERMLATNMRLSVVPEMDMREAVVMYYEHVESVLGKGLPYLKIEQRISIPRVHPDCYGTPDATAYVPTSRTLYVWDFKYGRKPVEAEENWQCMAYAVGIMDEMELIDLEITVCIVIVQPRAYHADGPIRTWRVRGEELRPYANHMARGAREALEPNAPTRSGSYCRYCRARTVCSSAISAMVSLYESVGSVPTTDPSDDSIALLYALAKRAREHVEAMYEGYKAQLEHRISSGKMVRGYSLAPRVGNRKWTQPPEYIERFAGLMGVEATIKKLKSPAQLEKEVDPALLEGMTERTQSGHKIVQDDMKQVRRIFS